MVDTVVFGRKVYEDDLKIGDRNWTNQMEKVTGKDRTVVPTEEQ